jgi:hypothetical protein
MQDDFDKVMQDVRASFRLLYLYNKRILDLMKYISSRFGINYVGGWTKYSDPTPRNGRGCLDNWGWDWLNMYLYEFHFEQKTDTINFSILLQSDTGIWDGNFDKRDYKLNMGNYESIEKSQTRLIFVISTKYWDFNALLKCENMKSQSQNDFSIQDESGNKMVCKAFDIVSFKDELNTEQTLKSYVEYIKENGFSGLILQERDA